MDLKAHQLEAHPNGLSKDARKDARKIDMSEFSYRASHEPERRGGRGRGRGRDPNSEPLPQSSAQPMRRDELAYQRQMAIQSAQSVSTRTFGGQLTQPPTETFAARGPPRAQAPATVTATAGPATRVNESFPALGQSDTRPVATATAAASSSAGPPSPQPQASLTPQEQARQLRHTVVISRATNLLKNDQSKVNEFRTKISSFSKGSITAPELIDSFFTLFDTTAAELGKLVKELADIYEIPSRRDSLLKAWSDWKAINEDYPSLPGPANRPAGGDPSATTSGGARVLKLKSSTARRQAGWSSGFPPLLSNATGGGGPRSSAAATTTTAAWVTPSAPASASRTSRSPSRPLQSAGKMPAVSSEAFPALPAAPKPTSTLFVPGGGFGGAVRRLNGGPSTAANPWASAGAGVGAAGVGSGAAAAAAAAGAAWGSGDVEEGGEGGAAGASGRKKGSKKQKQTLIRFG
jgi:E3 ubiquitin-protein ligase ZNF598